MRKMASLIAQCGNSNNTKVKLPGRSVNVWGRDLSGTLGGAGGTGGLLAVQRGGAWHFPLYDGGGNITAYISESGAVAATYAYGPYGETVSHTGQDFDYRFSTKPYNEVLNTYRFAYREYAPDTGRWLSQDPIFERGGYNLYAYCGNDPVNGYDPLGKFTVYPTNDAPRFSSSSDFWMAVFIELDDKESSGTIFLKRFIKYHLCSCDGNSGRDKKDSKRIISAYNVSGKRSNQMYPYRFPAGDEMRNHYEIASLPAYSNYSGWISISATIGFSRGFSPSNGNLVSSDSFGTQANDMERHLDNYDDSSNKPVKSLAKASFNAVIRYKCENGTSSDLDSYYRTGNWGYKLNDRLDENGVPRSQTENPRSFAYLTLGGFDN